MKHWRKLKSKLRALEENIIPKLVENCGLSELDIRTVREAGMLIVQCRRVLKWSCVFDNFITEYESTKKQYLKHRRDQVSTVLCKHEGTLHELMNRALADGDFTCFKHMLETSTTYTGNYFDGFVKNLEDGMPEVKTEAYEDGSSSHWFCDRCTFENSWVDKQCKICFPSNSPPHVAASTGRPWKIGMRVMSKGHVSSVIDAGLVLCCSFSCVVLGLRVCFVCPLCVGSSSIILV